MTEYTPSDNENLTVRLWDTIHDARSTPSGHAPTSAIVAAVLPIIAAEVQAAKAEVWDEGYLDRSPYGGRARSRSDNPYRATETGDRA